MVPLKQGQLVVRYSGPLRRKEDHAAKLEQGMTTGDYAFRLGADWVIDGEVPESSSWGRFINHSKRRCNCEPVPVGPRALVSTLDLGDTWQNARIALLISLRPSGCPFLSRRSLSSSKLRKTLKSGRSFYLTVSEECLICKRLARV